MARQLVLGPQSQIASLVTQATARTAGQVQQTAAGIGGTIGAILQQRETAESREYIYQMSSVMEDDYRQILKDNDGDPTAFAEVWDAYTEKANENAPAAALQHLRQKMLAYRTQGLNSTSRKFEQQKRQHDAADLIKYNTAQQASILRLYRDGDTRQAESTLQETIQQNLDRGADADKVQLMQDKLLTLGQLQTVRGQIDRAGQEGGLEALNMLKDQLMTGDQIKDPRTQDQAVQLVDNAIGDLQREQAAETRKLKQQQKVLTDQVKDQVKAMSAMLTMGYQVSPDDRESVSTFVAMNDLLPQAKEMQLADLSYKFAQNSPGARQQIITNTTNSEVKQRLIKADKQLQQLENSDPLIHLQRQEQITLAPINPADPATWQGRNTAAKMAGDHLGRKVGILTKAERDQFNTMWNQADAVAKIQILGSMGQALGDDMPTTINDLVSEGNKQVAMMGQLFADGAPHVAQMVALGQEVMTANKEVIPSKTDLEPQLNTLLGNAYQLSPTQRAGTKQAITAAYAQLSNQEGDFSGELDSDRLETATKLVTGGLIEYTTNSFMGSGYWGDVDRLEPPSREVTSDQFTEWVEALTPEQIAAMGPDGAGPGGGYTAEQVKEWLSEGARLQSIRVENHDNPVYIVITPYGAVPDQTGQRQFYLTWTGGE